MEALKCQLREADEASALARGYLDGLDAVRDDSILVIGGALLDEGNAHGTNLCLLMARVSTV